MDETRNLTPSFEDFAYINGDMYWMANDFMKLLGYRDEKEISDLLDKVSHRISAIGGGVKVYKEMAYDPDKNELRLTRYACLVISETADIKKPEVKLAREYFQRQLNLTWRETEANERMDRLTERQKLVDHNRGLQGAANRAGVINYAGFANAGYLGMYNKLNFELARARGVPSTELLEHMGSAELAANAFRVVVAKERLEKENTRGQAQAEQVHKEVGRNVRAFVKSNLGVYPEHLPKTPPPLPEVKKGEKEVKKLSKEIDRQERARRRKNK